MPHPARYSPLCRFGHIASFPELLDGEDGWRSAALRFRGHGPVFDATGVDDVGRARRFPKSTGPGSHTQHLRNDVYVCAHIDDEEFEAARTGALLDCVTVLRRLGMPVTPDPADDVLHLRMRRRAGRAAVRARAAAGPIRSHWNDRDPGLPTLAETRSAARAGVPVSRLQVSPAEALRQALKTCLSPEQGLAVIRAITPAVLSPHEVEAVVAASPQRVRRALRELGVPEALSAARAAHLEVSDDQDRRIPGRH